MDLTALFSKYKNDKKGFIKASVGENASKESTETAGALWEKYGESSKTSKVSTPTQKIYDLNKGESILGSLKGDSKISEIPANELVNPKPYIDAIKQFNPIDLLKAVGNDIVRQVAMESQLRTDINEKIGIAGELSAGLRDEILNAYPAAVRFGYGIENVTSMIQTMMETSGRFNLISQQTIEKSYATARAFVGDLSEMGKVFTEFERVGIGASTAMNEIDKAGTKSLQLGLRAKTTITDIRNNIDMLNKYGFQNGIQGLAEMSRRAVEFRMNMGEAFKIADNVMDPEKALSLTANLQVLGGAIGDFNDPLKLMYMATNNVEGLQNALIGAAGSLATYNREQGRFEITGVNLRRAKEMASELGIEYNELAKGAIAAQERQSASLDLMGKGFDISEEDKTFITNLSRMEGGKMVVEIPQSLSDKFKGESKLALSDLTEQQIQVLKDNREQFKKLEAADIARDQFTSVKNIERDIDAMAKRQLREISQAIGGEKGIGAMVDTQAKGLYDLIKTYTDKTMGENRKTELTSMVESVREKLKTALTEGGMGELSSVLKEQMKLIQDKLKSSNQTTTPPTQTTTPTTNKTINEITIKADTNGDSLAREIIRNQDNYRGIFIPSKGDYLSTQV